MEAFRKAAIFLISVTKLLVFKIIGVIFLISMTKLLVLLPVFHSERCSYGPTGERKIEHKLYNHYIHLSLIN